MQISGEQNVCIQPTAGPQAKYERMRMLHTTHNHLAHNPAAVAKHQPRKEAPKRTSSQGLHTPWNCRAPVPEDPRIQYEMGVGLQAYVIDSVEYIAATSWL